MSGKGKGNPSEQSSTPNVKSLSVTTLFGFLVDSPNSITEIFRLPAIIALVFPARDGGRGWYAAGAAGWKAAGAAGAAGGATRRKGAGAACGDCRKPMLVFAREGGKGWKGACREGAKPAGVERGRKSW
jgi:hypothetical protein